MIIENGFTIVREEIKNSIVARYEVLAVSDDYHEAVQWLDNKMQGKKRWSMTSEGCYYRIDEATQTTEWMRVVLP